MFASIILLLIMYKIEVRRGITSESLGVTFYSYTVLFKEIPHFAYLISNFKNIFLRIGKKESELSNRMPTAW